MLSPSTISYFSSPSSSQSASLIRTKIPGRLKLISAEFYFAHSPQLEGSLHRAIKDKKFLSLVFHEVLAKIPNQVCDVGGSILLVSGWYLDGVFAFVAEEHFQTSAEEVNQRHRISRKTYVNSTMMLIILFSSFFVAIPRPSYQSRT